MDTGLDIAQIVIAVVLMAVILTQSKGSGFSGGFGGDTSSIHRTRRGVEKTLFQFTIAAAVVFVGISIVATLMQ
ncbi:MAG TPA: preprotein translocase subunit SecG [Thermomicrobiales bacterium]|nr:preprotein translocase subunit SecG [Thermomicrobiales bacterium]